MSELEITSADAPPASLLGQLQAQRAQIARKTSTTIPLPGFRNPQVVVRYRFLPPERLDELGRGIRQETERDNEQLVLSSIDVLIEACEGIYVRERGSTKLEPLAPYEDKLILTFNDARLADCFGFESNEARDLVRGVFVGPGGVTNDYAIIDHAQLLLRWFGDTSVRTDEEALGGSD